MGTRRTGRHRSRSGRALSADSCANLAAAFGGPSQRRNTLNRVGYRVSPGLLLAECPCGDPEGELRHDGGVVRGAPGMYALGLPVLRRRKSTFINGAEADARDLAEHLIGYLAGCARPEGPSSKFPHNAVTRNYRIVEGG